MPVVIREMDGKGNGLVATKDFKRGDVILEDKGFKILKDKKIQGLSGEDLSDFMKLSRKKSCLEIYREYERSLAMDPDPQDKKTMELSLHQLKVDQICATNAIGGYIYLTLSLLNHSCTPNAEWRT